MRECIFFDVYKYACIMQMRVTRHNRKEHVTISRFYVNAPSGQQRSDLGICFLCKGDGDSETRNCIELFAWKRWSKGLWLIGFRRRGFACENFFRKSARIVCEVYDSKFMYVCNVLWNFVLKFYEKCMYCARRLWRKIYAWIT